MFGVFAELVKIPLQGVVNYFQGKQEIKKAAAQNRARLLRDDQSNNQEWEMRQLEGRDKWLRRLSFSLLSFPVVMAWVDPQRVNEYFEVGLAAMPDWYIGAYMGIIGAVWGISEYKNFKR